MGPGSFFVNRMLMSGFGAAAVNVRGSSATPNGGQAFDATTGRINSDFNYDGFFIPNAIQYQSPSFNGWVLNAMTTTSGGAVDGLISTTGRQNANGLAVDTESYQAYTLTGSIGPVGVGAGYQSRKNVNNSISFYGSLPVTSDLTIVASYISNDETKRLPQTAGLITPAVAGNAAAQIDPVAAVAGMQTQNNATGAAGTGLKIGSTSIFANYRLSDALSAQFGYARNDTTVEQSLTSLSMKYNLSKQTFTYVSYAAAAGGAEASFSSRANFRFNNAAAVSTSNVMVGLAHSF